MFTEWYILTHPDNRAIPIIPGSFPFLLWSVAPEHNPGQLHLLVRVNLCK